MCAVCAWKQTKFRKSENASQKTPKNILAVTMRDKPSFWGCEQNAFKTNSIYIYITREIQELDTKQSKQLMEVIPTWNWHCDNNLNVYIFDSIIVRSHGTSGETSFLHHQERVGTANCKRRKNTWRKTSWCPRCFWCTSWEQNCFSLLPTWTSDLQSFRGWRIWDSPWHGGSLWQRPPTKGVRIIPGGHLAL